MHLLDDKYRVVGTNEDARTKANEIRGNKAVLDFLEKYLKGGRRRCRDELADFDFHRQQVVDHVGAAVAAAVRGLRAAA